MRKRKPDTVRPSNFFKPDEGPQRAGSLMEIAFQGATIRSLMIGNVPWFVVRDVCDALELVDTTSALRGLDEDEKSKAMVSTPGGIQEMSVIDESGFYSLAFISRKTEAKKFRKWVTREVLPSLRGGGAGDFTGSIPPVGHLALQDLEDETYVRNFYSPEVDALALATCLVGTVWRKFRLLDGLSALNEHSNTTFQLGKPIQIAEHIAQSAMRTKRELIDKPDAPAA